MIVKQPRILSDTWLIIGQQVLTRHGGYIDLLGIDANGSLVIVELKKAKTPRDVVAQAIDYASWVKNLEPVSIANIYDDCREKLGHKQSSLNEAYEEFFGNPIDEDTLNDSHQIVVVASHLDASTERIVNYLNDLDFAINVLFFEVYQHGEERLISRTWLTDPIETAINASNTNKGEREPWNQEFYVSFGHDHNRDWEEARKYGFISAGGGAWYSRTLQQLQEGDRVWVNIPKAGYVGVGKVTSPAVPSNEYPNREKLTSGLHHSENDADLKLCEYFVEIDWIKTVDLSDAYRETGFFGNQNSVCKPTAKSWIHTVNKLKTFFSIAP